VVSFAVLSALSGVTGGIDDLGVSFGSGGSLWRVVVVVNDREAVNLEAGFCALRRRSGLLFRGNIAIPEELIVFVMSADTKYNSSKPLSLLK
jgi:hypothetical protein